jgi:serine phosphatase RsbU (regulator of sigma subunit)
VAAYRNARRSLDDLPGTYRFLDEVLVSHGGGVQFATALLVELDVPTGVLQWLNAGHLAPLLLRNGQLVRALEVDPVTPVGLGLTSEQPLLGRVQLEPGDRVLLYTDGMVEARTPDGEFFGVTRLVDRLVRESASGHHPPEVLRRVGQAVLAHQKGELSDDATTVLIEWRGDSQLGLLPR